MALSRRALGGVLLAGMIHVCHADEWDVVNFHARAAYQYDNNIFRLRDNEPAQDGHSDHIATLGAGLTVDKPFGQQRFRLNGLATRHKYNKHDFLDHTTKDYLAAWDWSLTPRVTGVIAAQQEESLTSAAAFRNQEDRNIRTLRDRRFQVDWWVHSNWHLLAEAGQDETHYETEEGLEDDRGYDRTRWGAGLRFDAGNERTLTAMLFKRDADYDESRLDEDNFRDNTFEEDEFQLELHYPFGGNSRVNARLSYLDRSYPHVGERDFSGWTGNVRFTWGLTEKLLLLLGYRHDLGAWQDEEASYADMDIIAVGATWHYSQKQRLELRGERKDRDHRGRLPGITAAQREDRTHSAIATWIWVPNLTTELSAGLFFERRDSNRDEFNYDAHGFQLSVHQMF
ncbi:MAG TPA: XrtB/PEP-CTERM-associated polysaccharide biosynthesis outer membrane protein EpsL [Burkholderiales bacterium]|nr:XrtB/PEP-CTERM-associated polysaccharide biosynthesis outer membrane protein EpsL [Burkholderiales bacterium]